VHDRIEIICLKPQQYTISIWLVIPVTNGAVMVLHFEAVQLKDNLSIPKQLVIG
jgi:hypothetical protein